MKKVRREGGLTRVGWMSVCKVELVKVAGENEREREGGRQGVWPNCGARCRLFGARKRQSLATLSERKRQVSTKKKERKGRRRPDGGCLVRSHGNNNACSLVRSGRFNISPFFLGVRA